MKSCRSHCSCSFIHRSTFWQTPSVPYRDYGEGFILTKKAMTWYWGQYIADEASGMHPYASPLRAGNLTGVAPALIFTAEFDPLRDEGELYAARLKNAGVDVELSSDNQARSNWILRIWRNHQRSSPYLHRPSEHLVARPVHGCSDQRWWSRRATRGLANTRQLIPDPQTIFVRVGWSSPGEALVSSTVKDVVAGSESRVRGSRRAPTQGYPRTTTEMVLRGTSSTPFRGLADPVRGERSRTGEAPESALEITFRARKSST